MIFTCYTGYHLGAPGNQLGVPAYHLGKPESISCLNVKCQCLEHRDSVEQYCEDLMESVDLAANDNIPLSGSNNSGKKGKTMPGRVRMDESPTETYPFVRMYPILCAAHAED